LIGDLCWIKAYHRLNLCGPHLWKPLPQQRGLTIAGRSGNERDGLGSVSSQLEKPLTSDDTVLRDSRPSVAG
jgi:hypothetical protein